MRKVGMLDIDAKNQDSFYSEDNISFVCRTKQGEEKSMSRKELSEWAIFLNSPWSISNEVYEIKVNCPNEFTKVQEGELYWKCEYHVLGYDAIDSSCIGYGNTETEALEECKKLLKYLQKEYNPEDIAI